MAASTVWFTCLPACSGRSARSGQLTPPHQAPSAAVGDPGHRGHHCTHFVQQQHRWEMHTRHPSCVNNKTMHPGQYTSSTYRTAGTTARATTSSGAVVPVPPDARVATADRRQTTVLRAASPPPHAVATIHSTKAGRSSTAATRATTCFRQRTPPSVYWHTRATLQVANIKRVAPHLDDFLRIHAQLSWSSVTLVVASVPAQREIVTARDAG